MGSTGRICSEQREIVSELCLQGLGHEMSPAVSQLFQSSQLGG